MIILTSRGRLFPLDIRSVHDQDKALSFAIAAVLSERHGESIADDLRTQAWADRAPTAAPSLRQRKGQFCRKC
jgi:hypothetical protein